MMKNSIKKTSIFFVAFTLLCLLAVLFGCQSIAKKTVGLAWTTEDNYGHMSFAIDAAGGDGQVLDQVKCDEISYNDNGEVNATCLDSNGMILPEYANIVKSKCYEHTNVESVVQGKRAIVFPGGEDICPSLYKEPQNWYSNTVKPEFNPARDISDYILMSYCLDKNIPVMGICRGMQMYAVVAGAQMIQDLPTYFESKGAPYNKEHQKSGEINGENVRGNHPVYITDKNSILYKIFNCDVLDKPYSSHHQAVLSVDPTKTKVVATANINGVETIEALERADSDSFALFMQFHPEHSAARWNDDRPDKESFMDFDTSLKPFKYLLANI